jgi:hypothetical protein
MSWNGDPLEPPALQAAVIPAKAGIQSDDSTFPEVSGVDSRFRGNDWRFEWDPIPNDANTGNSAAMLSRILRVILEEEVLHETKHHAGH